MEAISFGLPWLDMSHTCLCQHDLPLSSQLGRKRILELSAHYDSNEYTHSSESDSSEMCHLPAIFTSWEMKSTVRQTHPLS